LGPIAMGAVGFIICMATSNVAARYVGTYPNPRVPVRVGYEASQYKVPVDCLIGKHIRRSRMSARLTPIVKNLVPLAV
jgi:hypothetical protein